MEPIQSLEIKTYPTSEENRLVGLTFEHMFISKLNEHYNHAQSTQDKDNPLSHWKYFADATIPYWGGITLLELKSNKMQDWEDTTKSTIKKIFKDGEKRARKEGVNQGLLWQYFRGVGAKIHKDQLLETKFVCIIGCYSTDSLLHLDDIKNNYEQAWKNYTHYVLFWGSSMSGVHWGKIKAEDFWARLEECKILNEVLRKIKNDEYYLENYYDLPKECGLNLSDDRLSELRKLAEPKKLGEPKVVEYDCGWGVESNQLWGDTIHIESDSDQLEEVAHGEKWANHSENTKEAMKSLKDQGEYTGGKTPLGWKVDDNGNEIPDHDEQNLINLVREYRAQNLTYAVIAAKLTYSDFTSRTGNGIFSKSMAKRINDAETIEERHERLFENIEYTYPIIDQGDMFSKQEILQPESLKKIEDGIKDQVELRYLSIDLGYSSNYLTNIFTNKDAYKSENWIAFKKWLINLMEEVDYKHKPTCTIHSIEAAQKEISKYKQTLTNLEKKLEKQDKKHKAEQKTVKEMVELHTKQRNEINDLKTKLSNQETKQVDETTALKLEAYQAEIEKLKNGHEESVTMQVVLTKHQRDWLRRQAFENDSKMSKILRSILDEAMEEELLKEKCNHAFDTIHRYERIIDMIMDK